MLRFPLAFCFSRPTKRRDPTCSQSKKYDMKKRGPFKLIASREVYKNPWIRVREDKVIRPDGKSGIFGIVEICHGLSVVPIDNKGYCWILKEYGYGQGVWHFTLPAGGIEKGETPLKAAKRELLEEMGLESAKWRGLGSVYFYTTFLHINENLFLASDVRQIRPRSEEDRQLSAKLYRLPFKKVVGMALDGKISSGADIVAVLRAADLIKKTK